MGKARWLSGRDPRLRCRNNHQACNTEPLRMMWSSDEEPETNQDADRHNVLGDPQTRTRRKADRECRAQPPPTLLPDMYTWTL